MTQSKEHNASRKLPLKNPSKPTQTASDVAYDKSDVPSQGSVASGDTSDGFHTFNELYEHRIALFIALMFTYPERSWVASKHEDGSRFDGWFIAGMHLPTGDITYHLPTFPYFNEIGINKDIQYFEFAPHWDGHSPADVVKRLHWWANEHLTSKRASPKPKAQQKGTDNE